MNIPELIRSQESRITALQQEVVTYAPTANLPGCNQAYLDRVEALEAAQATLLRLKSL